jgi:phosphate:Na+ symporter
MFSLSAGAGAAAAQVCRKTPGPATRRSLAVTALLALSLLPGCDDHPGDVPPARIDAIKGDNQCGAPGELLEPLVVRVLGPRTRDFLGRRGRRFAAIDVEVTFEVENFEAIERAAELTSPALPKPYPILLPSPAADPALGAGRISVSTDDSGRARVWVRLGTEIGDWRVSALISRGAEKKDLKEHFRVVCGVQKMFEEREAVVGEKVPLRLRLVGARPSPEADGAPEIRPLKDRVVIFRVVGEPFGVSERAELSNKRDVTGSDGIRKGTDLTLGDRAGVYYVLAEVEPLEERGARGAEGRSERREAEWRSSGKPIRGILFRIVAMDWLQVGLQIAGGALIFLIGVRFLGNGMLLILSRHVHLPTTAWASNRMLGYGGGLLAGATFQSASTVTSYLISFANGGLLSARGGLGLVLGAAAGATLLPQILSLQLDFLSVPLLGAGLLFLLLPRQSGVNSWGWVFLGGGLLLASWTILSSGTDLLSLSDVFRDAFLPPAVDHAQPFHVHAGQFCVFLGAGVGLGFLLRTSNLIVVLAMLLAAKDVIAPASCVPLIMGSNLGSAILIFLRSYLKLREARRLAAIHLLMHLTAAVILGALALLPVKGSSLFLWLVELATPGKLFHPLPENVAPHIAMAHTLYNLMGGLLVLAFPSWLLRLTDRIIPPRTAADDIKPYHLDEHLIPVPSLALRQAAEEVVYLTELCQKTIAEAFDAFRYADIKLADQVVRREEVISGLHRDVARYLVMVQENQLSRHDASEVEVLQSAAGSLARIGEIGERLRDLTARRMEEEIAGSQETDRDLNEVYDLLMAQFENILSLLRRRDHRIEESAVKLVERLAKFRSRLESQWRQRLEQIETESANRVAVHLQALIFQEAFDLLFRVASHLAHIAQRMRILSPERL